MAYTYVIYDEEGDKMRTAKRKEEADALIEHRAGWTYKRMTIPDKPQPIYEDAPF